MIRSGGVLKERLKRLAPKLERPPTVLIFRGGLQRKKSDVTQGRETGEIRPCVYTPRICFVLQKGLELFQSSPYQRSVQAVVVDEAHCILER